MSGALSKVEINAQVGINEVVAIYVSKYETGLSNRKAEVANAIRGTKQDLTDLIETIKGSIDVSKYATVDLSALDLEPVTTIDLYWEDTWNVKRYNYQVTVAARSSNARGEIVLFAKTFPIDKNHVKEYETLQAKLKDQEGELQKIIMDLKSVNQKERQVRAKLAEMKLQEAGVDLHSHPDLLALVELK